MALSNSKNGENANFKAVCNCLEGGSCAMCSASGGYDLVQTLSAVLGKLDKLNSQLISLKGNVNTYNNRLKKLEMSSNEGSDNDSESVSGKRKHRKPHKRVSNKRKSKPVEVKENSCAQTEDSASEDRLGLRDFEKSRNRVYEESDSSDRSSETSGTGSKRRRKRRRTVKSGAEVKQRPVVKTELWPHTIANEDDGEVVNSEDISLEKILSCFTHILITCKETEAAGRSVLLHAVSIVLECLPWTEARCFHNLTMVKIEQGRLSWGSNFAALAKQFLDKKVRMTLKSKGYSTGNNSYSQTSRSSNFNKGFGNPRYGYDNNKGSNSSLSVICRLWNGGICSFGASCKRWHVCLYCAEKGKLGEPHKATIHDCSSPRNYASDQPI